MGLSSIQNPGTAMFLEILGYLLASIDLFDKTNAVELRLRRTADWMGRVARRFPWKLMLGLYLLAGGGFRLYMKWVPNALEADGPSTLLHVVILLVLASPAYFVAVMLMFRLLHYLLGFFSRHPKGILGALGLVLTAVPRIWKLLVGPT